MSDKDMLLDTKKMNHQWKANKQ